VRITALDDPVISIIDDDEAARSAVAALVRASGYQTLTYESAESFLASPGLSCSSCIITDVQMPGLTGIELKHRLDAAACRTPVIMITARVEERLHAQARDSGAFGFLRKPFKASVLMDCVRRALSQGADANTVTGR
jgi:FixJ family two-component response regulator